MSNEQCIIGWLSPEGHFYKCAFMDHYREAEKIIKENNMAEDFDNKKRTLISCQEDDYLLSAGYIKFVFNELLHGGMIIFPARQLWNNRKITDKQVRWCDENFDKFDEKQMCTYIEHLKYY